MSEGHLYHYPHFEQLTHLRYLEADNILQQWRKEQKILIKLLQQDVQYLLDNLWQEYSPLAFDSFCSASDHMLCSQCQESDNILSEATYTDVASHHWKNLRLSLEKVTIPRLFLRPNSQLSSYIRELDRLTYCGTPENYQQLRLIQGDAFTISTLLQTFFYHQLRQKKLYTIQPLWKVFICQQEAKSVVEPVDYRQLPQKFCRAEIIFACLLQALVTWKELIKYHASFGDIQPGWFGFQEQEISLNLHGIKILSPITLWFSHFGSTSATINNTHYYSERPQILTWQHQFLLAPQLERKSWRVGHNDVYCYRLQRESWQWYHTVRHLGAPLFIGSWDFYCFMISFVLDPNVLRLIKQYPELDKFWSFLWLPQEVAVVEQRLRQRLPVSEILLGLWLRCQIIDDLIAIMQNYNIF